MTIAACYLCPEGVVFGADSTATFSQDPVSTSGQYYNYTQKVFEVGDGADLGMVYWGLGGLGNTSYRTLIALLADRFAAVRPNSVSDAAWQWHTLIWNQYCSTYGQARQRALELKGKGSSRTPQEEKEFRDLIAGYRAGFCIGGCCGAERRPEAYELWVQPHDDTCPAPRLIPMGIPHFWGWSNVIERVSYGMDNALYQAILTSGKWGGTPQELLDIVIKNKLAPAGLLPIRDAIDWVFSSIYTTIKGFKFSRLDPVCGGPIEIAVVTTDRKFRWVRHKRLDAAIAQNMEWTFNVSESKT